VRLQKYLAEKGLASRRQIESWIKDGRLRVNGQAPLLGAKVTDQDQIYFDGKLVGNGSAAPRVYWLLNKPDLTLVGKDPSGEKLSIYDLPKLKRLPFRVMTSGRLDYRTEGMLVLSNDGDFLNNICHPSKTVEKEYYATVNRLLSNSELEALRSGVRLRDGLAKCDIKLAFRKKLGSGTGACYSLVVVEGRNRLVRRLFEHFGVRVNRLVRTRIGQIEMPESLLPGEYVQLDGKQIGNLLKNP